MLHRRSDSSLRGHAASRNGGCLDTTQHLGSRRRQRTINISHRYVSWSGATLLNVRLWDRQLQRCAHIDARHVPALTISRLQRMAVALPHQCASFSGIIKERSTSPIDTAPGLGQRFQTSSFGLDNVIIRSHSSIHETKHPACSGGWHRLCGLTRRSSRTQPARAASIFLHRDFSSLFNTRSQAGPLNSGR